MAMSAPRDMPSPRLAHIGPCSIRGFAEMRQAWFLLALSSVFLSSPNALGAHGVLPLTALALMLAGCSSAAVSDNRPDATPLDSSAIDSSDVALPDVASPVADSSVDALEASTPACAQAVAVGCTPYQPRLGSTVDFSNCPPTWNDAIAFCVMYAGAFGYAQTDCGTYVRWHIENIDVGCSYYYDKASGDLIAVFCGGMGNTTCLGGPPGFTEPACAPIQYRQCVSNDALGDGGNGKGATSTD